MTGTLNRILVCIAAALAAVIIAGTVVGLTHKKPAAPAVTASSPEQTHPLNTADNQKLAAYRGLPQIRAATKPDPAVPDSTGTPLVVTLWFSYPENDTDLFEEIVQKKHDMIAVITGFFSQYTEAELKSMGEDKVKSMILDELNSLFVLGKISAVYFTDYIFLE